MSKSPSAVLLFVENGFEDMELMYPKYRLEEAGYEAVIAGPRAHEKYIGKHGYPCKSDASIVELRETSFAGVICPGGWAPDLLRRDAKVKSLVADFHRAGKIVAAICHGGWLPISAGIYRGVRVTGSLGIKDDLINAGALFEDAPVVVDGQFVSSRKPDDLPAFMRAVLEGLAAFPGSAAVHNRRANVETASNATS
jgi:protease I